MLVTTVTAFTLAHSITLALATLGVVHVPGPPVEAAIALSILLLACEIARTRAANRASRRGGPGWWRSRFGLLHGFGFAGALSEIGLPRGDIPLALFTFNVGVEIGQLAFIAAVLTLLASYDEFRPGQVHATGPAGRDLRDRHTGRVLVRRARRSISAVKPSLS